MSDARRIAQDLNGGVKITTPSQQNITGSMTNIGSLVNTPPPLTSLTYKFANSTSAAVSYIVGDSAGMIAAKLSGSFSAPTAVNGNTSIVTANKQLIGFNPIKFGAMILETTSSTTQFNNVPSVHVTNHSGQLSSAEVDLQSAKTNVAQNAKILHLQCEINLSAARAITQTVDAGETLMMTLKPLGYKA